MEISVANYHPQPWFGFIDVSIELSQHHTLDGLEDFKDETR